MYSTDIDYIGILDLEIGKMPIRVLIVTLDETLREVLGAGIVEAGGEVYVEVGFRYWDIVFTCTAAKQAESWVYFMLQDIDIVW
ncbi:hypothetical protein IAQ61_007146 [Plenodomus lingam]|uniref:uncharacterized protein n=1 Tax=Leptosphaeria maculans TaxID=5022 RepID=UPI00331AFC52|nr:hypothetical protein IAQ61_007146 [Plenodomus lingam]